jgi:PleD family two-component response regulator
MKTRQLKPTFKDLIMSKGKILFVANDESLMSLVKVYLEAQGYIVQVLSNGEDVISQAQSEFPPDAIVVTIQFARVYKELVINSQTNLIPLIVLLTQEERENVRFGMLEPYDIITMPFDFEEFERRVAYQIEYSKRPKKIHPKSGFPTKILFDEFLHEQSEKKAKYALIDVKINDFSAYKDVYGSAAADEVIKLLALLIMDVLEASGKNDDFVGHLDEVYFGLICFTDNPQIIIEQLKMRFDIAIQEHYKLPGVNEVPLMSLAIRHEIKD